MYAFSSKYALALYEMVQKRGGLKFKHSDEFPLDRFRSLLGVEEGKLEQFKNFKQRAIDPAVLEVNGLGEYGCKVEPIMTGRKVTAVKLSWWTKSLDEKKAALEELRYSRVGRRARLAGKVEQVSLLDSLPPMPTHPNLLPSPHPNLLPSRPNALTEKQVARFRRDFPGLDIEYLESEFREWVETQESPHDYAAAFYGFVRKRAGQS